VSNAAAKAGKKPFFAIYKPGQGKWVRWGTVGGMALVAGLGAYWIGAKYFPSNFNSTGMYGQVISATVWLLVWSWLTFWFVNSPKYGEFLIMTESEMRKVSWPSRREVSTSVKIVILLTFLMGLMLGLVDIGFIKLFQWMGIT
jgi:preprotein translocase SecE subunit